MTAVRRLVIAAGGARAWSLTVSVLILAVSARALGEEGPSEFATVFALALLEFDPVSELGAGRPARGHRSQPRLRLARQLLSTLAAFAA